MRCVDLFVIVYQLVAWVAYAAKPGVTWNLSASALLQSVTCTVDRVDSHEITETEFARHYRERRPVIVRSNSNFAIREATEKQRLLTDYGNVTVTLSTANTISHGKRPLKLREYLEGLGRHDPDRLGNETLYLFGPISELGNVLGSLLRHYTPPSFADDDLAFSFGIGASGTGVPFHVHGQGWSEVLHGRKRWLLYPPRHEPPFDPDESSASWLRRVYPTLRGDDRRLLEDCVIEPGEALYFPSMWWHATVNVGESVFVSSFEARQSPEGGQRGSLPFWATQKEHRGEL
mmetsp:Transcript_18247/g.43645  ORF Transcript_18247/g.43645 Transcript_18247/m.43645 type:complete len:289 (-) Transcript_18247:144-1010(-)